MGFSLKCERTYENDLVHCIMTMPEMWATVAEDNQDPEDFKPNCKDDCWLLIEHGSTVIGLYNMHAENSTTLTIHAQILPDQRKIHSSDASYKFWNWVLNECPEQYQKFNCQIPDIYPNVRAHAERMGMVLEGINRKSYLKNGIICDQWMLGITKNEIAEFLGGVSLAKS